MKQEEMMEQYKHRGKIYDRKIKVKCYHCGKIYTKWADEKLNHTLDGSECKCKPFFLILKEIKK